MPYRPVLSDLLRSLERHPRYPASILDVAAAGEAETYPNISLFMCLQRELGDDSLVDTTRSLTHNSTLLVAGSSRNCSVLPVKSP
jgi:hypothetical protein